MKSYVDFFETFKGEFVGSLKFKNKFIRLWGTQTIDGVEVLRERFEVYPNTRAERVQKLLRHIGADKDVNSADMGSVESYYFWINPSKAETLSQDNLEDLIAEKVNLYCEIGEKLRITINISDVGDYIDFKDFTRQQIYDYIVSDYDTNFNRLDQYAVGDTLLTTTIGSYIPFDKGEHFTVSVVNASVSSIPTKQKLNSWDHDIESYITVYKAGISVELEAIRKSNLSGSAKIVQHIVDEKKEYDTVKLQQLLESESNESTDGGSIWIRNRKPSKTDDVWYKGKLRIGFLNSSYVQNKKKIAILISSIDTGYTRKKVSRWKKWIYINIALGIVVIASILAAPTGGWSLATGAALLEAIAITMGIAALTLSLLQIALSKSGKYADAEFIGRFVKVYSAISAITGIASIIANIARQVAIQSATTTATAATGAAGTATATATFMGQTATVTATTTAAGTTTAIGVGAGTGIVTTASVSFTEFLSVGWDTAINGMTSSVQSMISTGLKAVRFFTGMRMERQAKSLQSENNSLREQYDKAQAELEAMNDKELNIAVEDIKWYTNELNLQSQVFGVDKYYGGTKMNIGRCSFITGRGSNVISDDIYDTNKI